MSDGLGLSRLEVASGNVFGEDRSAPELPTAGRGREPRKALEDAVRSALLCPPCVVTFSGGRDSSAVLALAVDVARREGLALPIPITYRFPGRPASDESSWQERVVSHLGVDDWVRSSFDDELDCLGPLATPGLRRHGLLWPPNAHAIVPALELAGSGSVLTGQGGDEILYPGRYAHLAGALARIRRPTPRDAAKLLLASAPAPLRARRRRREGTAIELPWLRPAAARAVLDAFAREAAGEPIRRRAWVRWSWRLRSCQLTLRSMDLLARDKGTRLVHPFLDGEFLSSFADRARTRPPGSRPEATRVLFGDLLPPDVCERRTKATFDGAFWGRHSRAFALSLSPRDLDSDLVDGRAALAFWESDGTETCGPVPSSCLLQALWLERIEGSAAGGPEQHGAGGLESLPVAGSPQL